MVHELSTIRENYRRVADKVSDAAIRSGRSADAVKLITVTKFVDTEHIAAAIEAGAYAVGENRPQEFRDKFAFFTDNGVEKHAIGQIQLNKVKYLVGKADLIQSVDNINLAREIDDYAGKHFESGFRQRILIEVNIGAESQKSGVLPQNVTDFAWEISQLKSVMLCGIMTVPPVGSVESTRVYFTKMRELFQNIQAANIPNTCIKELSMGMSHDYVAAIEEGATMVRVGSAIFGDRYAQQATITN